MTIELERLLPLTGILSVVLLVFGGVLVTSAFAYWITPEQALEAFNRDPARIQRGALLAGFYAAVLFILFAGSLISALRAHEGPSGPFTPIALAGATLCAIALAIGYGALWVAATRASRPEGITPDYAVVYNDLYSVLLANVATIGLAALIGATGLVSLRTGLFPTWLGWVSVAFAVGLMTPLHWIFEGLALVWIIAVSVLLYLQG
jgi:hypothetical protein